MTPKYLLILILVAGTLLSCRKDKAIASYDIFYERDFGGDEDDIGNSLIISNNSIYLFGTTKSFGDLNGDHYLVKTDLAGNKLFEKSYGGSMAEVGIEILPTSDGNFLLVGSTESLGSGLRDVHLLKVDSQGTLIWEKTYGGALDDKPANIIETAGSQYCIIGTTESYGSGGRDFYVLWVDQNGTLMQEKYYGGNGSDGGTDLIETETGDLWLYGYTDNYGAVNRDFYLMKVNADGDSLWAQPYGGGGYEESHDLEIDSNGDLFLIGHSASEDPEHNMLCVKTDANGTLIWERNFGGLDHDGAHAGIVSKDGNLVIVGRSKSYGMGERQILFVICSPAGATIYEKTFGSSGDDWSQNILEHESSYYVVGQTAATAGDDNLYLLRIDPSAN